MANRFLNNITINDEYTLPSADGTADQIITTDGAGQLSFVDQSTLNSGSAERTEILVKNVHGSALSKGDPVYIVGSVGASDRLEVALADASDAAKMPCVGLLTQDLANNGEGTATVTGKLRNLITSPIDGATPTENDTIYVKSGGGLTLTKPTGSTNLIQNVGQVGRVSTSSDGNIVVSAILRSNDVPNLPTGRIWVGEGNTIVSDVVYLDEANERMGIVTTSPQAKVHASDGGTVPSIDAGTMFLASNTSATGDYSSMSIISGTSGIASLYFGDTDAEKRGSVRYLNSSDEMRFRTANTDRVTIKSGGNVGIGTTNPSEKLDVNGSVAARETGAGNGFLLHTNSGISANNNLMQFWSGQSGGLSFHTNSTGDGSNERMRIASDGNVGIGTTSPSQKLEISDSSAPTIRINNTKNGTWTAGEIFGGLEWYGNDASGEGPGVKGYIKLDSDNIYGAGFDMRFGTTDGTNGITERMVITKTGSVGVGVAAPVAKLHIGDGDGGSLFYINGQYNDVAFNGSTSGTNGVWSFINSASWDQTRFYVQDANNFDSRLTFRFTGNNGANEILAGTSTGKVGIGTTDPTAKLDIDNIGSNSTGLRVSAGTNTQFAVETGSTNDGIVKINGLDAVTRVYLNGANSGSSYFTEKLGIGKSSDIEANLDVEGPIRAIGGTFSSGASGADSNASAGIVLRRGKKLMSGIPNGSNEDFYLRSLLEQTTSGAIIIGQGGTGLISDIALKPGTSGNITFFGSGSEDMRINNAGNVGIGTTSPGAKLDIDSVGSSATGIRMSAGTNEQFAVKTDGTNNCYVQVNGNDAVSRVTLDGASSGTNIFKNDTSFGTSTSANGRYVYIEGTTSTTVSNLMAIKSTTAFTSTPGRIIDFINSSNTVVGRILMYGSSVQYSTSSDYRLKENVEDITNGIDRVKQLKPKKFNFINEPSRTIDGFLAHEVDNIVPGAVDGEKDAVDEEGNPIYQGIDQSKMVPLLTAALQEAITKIEQLESRIQTLENN